MARLLENLGFTALATTSAGLAFSLGRRDGDGAVSAATFGTPTIVTYCCPPRRVLRWLVVKDTKLPARGGAVPGPEQRPLATAASQAAGRAREEDERRGQLHAAVRQCAAADAALCTCWCPRESGATVSSSSCHRLRRRASRRVPRARTVRQLAPLFESRGSAGGRKTSSRRSRREARSSSCCCAGRTAAGPKGSCSRWRWACSLHADTWVHGNDRAGLLRLCRYGARGPVAESRLKPARRRPVHARVRGRSGGVTLVMTGGSSSSYADCCG